jgi:hypothetical protein
MRIHEPAVAHPEKLNWPADRSDSHAVAGGKTASQNPELCLFAVRPDAGQLVIDKGDLTNLDILVRHAPFCAGPFRVQAKLGQDDPAIAYQRQTKGEAGVRERSRSPEIVWFNSDTGPLHGRIPKAIAGILLSPGKAGQLRETTNFRQYIFRKLRLNL